MSEKGPASLAQSMGKKMLWWAKQLFPLPRSLTGPGVRDTLAFLQAKLPDLKVHSVRSGTTVFDWTVPQEWSMRDGFLEHLETGRRYCEWEKSNLHVVNYSQPVDAQFDLEELEARIYTAPSRPGAIPYRTAYYEKEWGFCISEEDKKKMPPGRYRAFIDCDHFDGDLLYGELVLEGELKQEILISTYICHPSMANNELSGPVLATGIASLLGERFRSRKYTYRFVFLPETIGALAFIHANLDELRKRVIAGFVVTCVGDDRAYSHIESRKGDSIADSALAAAFIGRENATRYSYLERDSDERQYCSPGVDLPVAAFARSKPASFPEYHTSDDNFNVVTAEGLAESFSLVWEILMVFERGAFPVSTVIGEPQLGKRKLYEVSTSNTNISDKTRLVRDLVAYSDGTLSVFDLALLLDKPLHEVCEGLETLDQADLISFHHRQLKTRL